MRDITVEQLFEAGAHFGHQTRRWNPKMAPYIFGSKDKLHIINLDITAMKLKEALSVASAIAAEGKRILFVGTKRQACDRVAEAAQKCGQYYVNHRWLGGMLTNWKTISQSIKKLEALENRLNDTNITLKKKEILNIQRKIEKFNRAIGGVRNMGGIPALLFVVDTIIDKTAIIEARTLGIPVIAICDTNSDPTLVDYPVPGNDDSSRAIDLYCSAMEDAIIEGLRKGIAASGVDVGALENPNLVEETESESEESSESASEENTAE
mgnify:CR=1 FL=1